MGTNVIMMPSEVRREYVPYEKNIHHHRAPTDDSIRLYKEMEEKSREELVGHVRLGGNNFDGVCAVFDEDFGYRRCYRFKYELNGDEYGFDYKSDPMINGKDELRRALEELRQHIVNVAMGDFVDDHINQFIEEGLL